MSRDYKVGFAKPPEKTQFKKGKSGNPKGRPKKSINTINLIEKEFQSKIPVKKGGNTRIITKQQAIITQTINEAVKGSFKDRVLALQYMERIDQYKEQSKVIIESIRKNDIEILNNFIERRKRENVLKIIERDEEND
ncbi:MAG: hypothetical protein EOM53_02005 [Alphaproteobacteria bacterium]|nr:hypothetical protein [Alphaproteobacteria bacterium]